MINNADVRNRRLDGLTRAREARRQKAHSSVVTTEISAQNRLSRLNPTRRSIVEQRLSQMPKHCRKTYLRAIGGRSPKSAIKSFCLECTGWQRAEVIHCTSLACPLWPYRPFYRENIS